MQLIYNDDTDQELYFKAVKSDLSGEFTGTVDGDYLPGAIIQIKEYKQSFTEVIGASVTWDATAGYWFVTIPAAYITQSGAILIAIAGTGMQNVTIEAEVPAVVSVDVTSQVSDALSTYDAPTKAEMDAAFTAIKGAGWTTETLQAIKAGQLTSSNVLTQVTTGLNNYAPATASNLVTANSNILLIKNITDYLTLANIKAQCATAISDASIPAAVWGNTTRTLTTTGEGGGATAQEIWEYTDRELTTAPATPSDINSILATYGAAKPADVSTAIANASLATASNLSTVDTNIDSIKAITDLLTLANIKAQTTGALNDAAIPSSVWTNTTRTLTSSGIGGGATATEIWSYTNRSLTAVPTGAALATDLETANTKLDEIKAKTDTIDWSMIKKALVMEIGNYDIPANGGAGNYTITLAGIGNASFTVDASGNRTLTSITVV